MSLLAKVITRIEGWRQHLFFIQDTIVPFKFPQLFLKENMLDVKSFKDKLPSGIEQNPQFQRLGRYPVSAQMSFRNFIYIEEDEDLTFLPKDFSLGFNNGSPSVSINTEPVRTDEEPMVEPATKPVNERVGTTKDSWGVPKEILLLFTLGVLQPALGRRSAKQEEDDTPVLSISNDDEGLEDCLELKDATACHLKISAITPPAWKGFLDNRLDVNLLDLHDHCCARQAIMDNAMNRRTRELLEVIKKLRGEADVMRAKELSREEECEGLRAKCEATMTDFDKNPVVLLLREKMSSLAAGAKEHKGNLDRLMLESQKWLGYQVSLLALESKLLHSDELGRLVGKLISSAITFGRCRAYEQVARIKKPFVLSKVKRYRPSYEKEHTQASNDLATATFSWLNEYVVDASASVEALLSKKPPTLQKLVPSRT
ncbi:hypothetical protein Tco_0873431 [Tanacetum coccineum]|uniref:Uncharacterized protein n=1 Tax=Tanacetum coccineum TaxID=301880 RepID=A0ABQ5BIS8_9ASTR